MNVNEFDLIERLTAGLPTNPSLVTGPGDDCAVLDLGVPDRLVLFKTDAVVEGVHFTAETPPEKIGHKALARCLSDIAAMAGTPNSVLVTLGLPADFSAERVERIYAGLNALARRYDVAVAGGETTRNPGGFLIAIAALGTVPRPGCVRRSGARPGDAIFVTGELGGSLAGHHLDFEPRLAEATWLRENFPPHAMIDLSDGLAGDLRHLLKASGVGAELHSRSLPIRRAARVAARETPGAKPALLAALTDGEDFELLFTVAAPAAVPLLDGWKAAFPDVRLSCIGKVTAGDKIQLRGPHGPQPFPKHGYVHFA